MYPTIPYDADKARILLEYIKYGIILIKTVEDPRDDSLTFYIKSPERLHIIDNCGKELGSSMPFVRDFMRKVKELTPEAKVVIKRSPYKNEFDDWDDSDSQVAFDEYKMLLMRVFSEEDLL